LFYMGPRVIEGLSGQCQEFIRFFEELLSADFLFCHIFSLLSFSRDRVGFVIADSDGARQDKIMSCIFMTKAG